MSYSETMQRKIAVDPAAEDSYWRRYYGARPNTPAGASYVDFGPAYGYGVNSYTSNPGRSFDDMESYMAKNWDSERGASTLDWQGAKHAARDAWNRMTDTTERAIPGDSDGDRK